MLPDAIETPRLRLAVARVDHAEALFAQFNNWAVVKWLSSPTWPPKLEQMRARIETLAVREPGSEDFRAIVVDDKPVGIITCRNRPASERQREAGPNIGYWLGEPYWGRGIMSEAVEGLVAAIFAAEPVPAIYSGLIEGNDASLRIQQKLGFGITGHGRLFSNPLQRDMPAIDTMLTRDEFEKKTGR